MMSVTLHVDLVWTDLEDFVEHFENELRIDERLRLNEKWASIPIDTVLGNLSCAITIWNDEPLPGISSADIVDMGRLIEVLEIYPEVGKPNRKYTRIKILDQGKTRKLFFINVGFIYDNIQAASETSLVIIEAVRYRRDRLKITVAEPATTGFAERLLKWLRERWGEDGIDEKDVKDAPKPPERRKAGRRKDSWNQDAIDRLLAGENEETVRAAWREAYKEGNSEYPEASAEGERKTWRERVMKKLREMQRT